MDSNLDFPYVLGRWGGNFQLLYYVNNQSKGKFFRTQDSCKQSRDCFSVQCSVSLLHGCELFGQWKPLAPAPDHRHSPYKIFQLINCNYAQVHNSNDKIIYVTLFKSLFTNLNFVNPQIFPHL